MKTVKLLVLDDDKVDRLLLERALQSSGFNCEITECEDGKSVISTVLETPFHCIFLDYLLPGENGLELVRKIRESGIRIPVVIMTSQGNETIAVELMKSGASDYLIKSEITGQSIGQILTGVLRVYEIEQERMKAELALKASEARLAEAQRIAKIGNWECEIATGTIYWSQEMYTIFEENPDVFTPTVDNHVHRIHEDDRTLVEVNTKKAFQGESFSFDFRIVVANGIKHAHSQGYVVKSANNTVTKIVGTLQDITERKTAEQEIHKARELAESSMKAREIFLANISHEMRTPMNAILGFTRLLHETELSKEQRGYIEAVQFSGQNLLAIINDVLDLAKIRSDKMLIEKHEFNLIDLVSNILSVLKPKAAEKGLNFYSHTDKNVPTMVKGDSLRLNQILTNLIANALKFTDKGGTYLDIRTVSEREKDFVIEFKIKDTGIGIPEDKQTIIFENFVQASSDINRKYGGTGLGLTIVKNLVELQKGKIILESKSGLGSTFTVQLPFERGDQEKTSYTPSLKVDSSGSLQGVSILVAEDNGVNQLLIRKVLEKVGGKVDIAMTGLEVLELIKQKQYDVILMDIQMPEMDGFEATRQIRSDSKAPYAEVPIIAMTAHVFDSDVDLCLSAGMNDHISKPFQPEVLYAKISKYIMENKVKVISLSKSQNISIDMTPIYKIGNGDVGFLNELVLIYDQQTPDFIDRLRGFLKSRNFAAIRSICHQIKSSYGIMGVTELTCALKDASQLLNQDSPETEIDNITHHINIIISLMSAITEEVKKSLRKTA